MNRWRLRSDFAYQSAAAWIDLAGSVNLHCTVSFDLTYCTWIGAASGTAVHTCSDAVALAWWRTYKWRHYSSRRSLEACITPLSVVESRSPWRIFRRIIADAIGRPWFCTVTCSELLHLSIIFAATFFILSCHTLKWRWHWKNITVQSGYINIVYTLSSVCGNGRAILF